MPSFRDDPSTWQALDFQLLQNGPVAMYFDPRVLGQDSAVLAGRGYQLDTFDCSGWSSIDAAQATLADALRAVDYRGRSLDALEDCLADLQIEGEGRVFIFHRFDVATDAIRSFANTLLDVIASIARYHLLFGARLLVLVQSNDPRLALDRVGSCPVSWNPREALHTSRGL